MPKAALLLASLLLALLHLSPLPAQQLSHAPPLSSPQEHSQLLTASPAPFKVPATPDPLPLQHSEATLYDAKQPGLTDPILASNQDRPPVSSPHLHIVAHKGPRTSNGQLYTIEGQLDWPTSPLRTSPGTLTLSHGGVYNSNHTISATVSHTAHCRYCGRTSVFSDRTAYLHRPIASSPAIELDFSPAQAVAVNLRLPLPVCPHLVDGTVRNGMRRAALQATVQYGILLDRASMAQVSYQQPPLSFPLSPPTTPHRTTVSTPLPVHP